MALAVAGVQLDFFNEFAIVSFYNNGKIHIVTGQNGCFKVPLYVAFTQNDVLIGENAKAYHRLDPTNCIYDFGKLFKKSYTDEELQELTNNYPYKLTKNESGVLQIHVNFMGVVKYYPFLYIFAMFMNKLLETALKVANIDQIQGYVMIFPDTCISDMFKELRMGLPYTKFRLLNTIFDTVAIEMAYKKRVDPEKKNKIITYNFTETAIRASTSNEFESISVIEEINVLESLKKCCVDHFLSEFGCDVTKDDFLSQKLEEECKKAADELITSKEYVVKIEHTLLEMTLKQEILDEILNKKDFFDSIEKIMTTKEDSEENFVLFAGKYSLLPSIRQSFLEIYKEENLLIAAIPDFVISYGAIITIFSPIKAINQMKFSAQLKMKEKSTEIQSNNIDEAQILFNDFSKDFKSFKEQIDEVSNYLSEGTKSVARDQINNFKEFLTTFTQNHVVVKEVEILKQQKLQLQSVMTRIIEAGRQAKDNFKMHEELANEEFENKNYEKARNHCDEILSMQFLTEEEKEKWENFQQKVFSALEMQKEQENEVLEGTTETEYDTEDQTEDLNSTLEAKNDEEENFSSDKSSLKSKEVDTESIRSVSNKTTESTRIRNILIDDIHTASDEENYAEALEICKEALSHFPCDEEILYFKACSLKELSMHSEAISDFTEVIQQNPGNGNAYFNRGECFFHSKLYNEALHDFQSYIQKTGNKPEMLNNLIAKTIFHTKLQKIDELIENGNYEEAKNRMQILAECNKKVETDLKVQYLIRHVKIMLCTDDLNRVEEDINIFLNANPGEKLSVLKLRAKCYEIKKQFDKAIQDMKEVYEMEPTEENLEQLERMKKKQNANLKKHEYFASEYSINSK
ncbi:endoplasmic reticulum chaperone BIP-like [Culicoides brevitarsis]|uniref:endoplasmic reticulum chaperone BIP-like n=1 Tax=Culicoides brevitarsis TaxID=469753 RepID=UPI00307C6953